MSAEDWWGADQPPEIDEGSHDLPPALTAADRVSEFVSEFGDGLVIGGGAGDLPALPPLYARDLEALARAVDPTP